MFNLLNLTQKENDFLTSKGMKFKLESYSQKGRYKFWSGRQVKHSDIQMIKTYYIRLYDKDNNKIFSVNIDSHMVAKEKLKDLIMKK